MIDLPTLQKKINFHASVTYDLFGAETSTNAAASFSAGIKGRFNEAKLEDDHVLTGDLYPVDRVVEGRVQTEDVPALNALNARLLDDYIRDAGNGVGRWNKIIQKTGIDFEFRLPHKGFNRRIGEFADAFVTPEGEVVREDEWTARSEEWLCSGADGEYIQSLMVPCREPGRYAGWVAEPRVGIDNQSGDFEYVRIS